MDIINRVWKNFADDRIAVIAGGIAFYGILAIVPTIAAFVSLYGYFSDPASLSSHLKVFSHVLPEGALNVIGDEIHQTAGRGGHGLFEFFGILTVAIWSANVGVKSTLDALNMVYREKECRSWLRLNAVSLAFTAAAIIFLLVVLASVIIVPLAAAHLEIASLTEWVIAAARWPALLAIVGLALAVLYRFGPDRATPRWNWVSWGSAFASVAWLVTSVLFSYYATNFSKLNSSYGSLAAVVGFMVWIWLAQIVILMGAQINAELEHQTARDTTIGREKLIGARRAKMADTIGEAIDAD